MVISIWCFPSLGLMDSIRSTLCSPDERKVYFGISRKESPRYAPISRGEMWEYIRFDERGRLMLNTDYVSVKTKGRRDVIDLTPMIQGVVSKSGTTSGIAVAFIPGSTAAITAIEFEPGLIKDIDVFFERILPYGDHYHHHETWHDDNGAAHMQAAMIGPSLTVPIVDGRITLGTWQQIVLIDFDTRSRNREVVVQIIS
jgi:secondary thiamine-phosphate synthase enzyme